MSTSPMMIARPMSVSVMASRRRDRASTCALLGGFFSPGRACKPLRSSPL
jgi:hypothetical protein